VKITTNNKPRDLIYAHELTDKERKEFDYLDWEAIEKGEDSAGFIRYKGILYCMDEFTRWDNPNSPTRFNWDGFYSDTYFSGIVIRWADEDCETVIVGRYYT